MRYISQNSNLILRENGVPIYHFINGELVVGAPSTNSGVGNEIDVLLLSPLYPTDLDGGMAHRIERVGMGSLTGFDYGGAPLVPFQLGFRGYFFEAPYVWASIATLVTGQRWEVVIGRVQYNGYVYEVGDIVSVTTGSSFIDLEEHEATPGSMVALAIPYEIDAGCLAQLDNEFLIKNRKTGPDEGSRWTWDNGYEPREEGGRLPT